MRRILALLAFVGMASGALAGPATAGQAPLASASFQRGTVEAKSWEGPIQGPWEWSKEVKVTSSDLTMTCDWLKVWPTKDGRDWEKIEATGKISINGRYVAADKTEWRVDGKAEAASYDAKTGQGVLKGSVDFTATNLATGATIHVVADKLIYDVKTRQFRFERGEKPVRVEWEQPAEKVTSPGGAGQAEAGPSGPRGDPSGSQRGKGEAGK